MIAFKISINGKVIQIAGQEDWAVLATHIDAIRDKQNLDDFTLRYSVGGLTLENDEKYCHHYRWESRDLKIGDQVQLEIVEADSIDQPKKRYRSDHKVQEDPFTDEEAKDLRYQDYLELKKEFENVT